MDRVFNDCCAHYELPRYQTPIANNGLRPEILVNYMHFIDLLPLTLMTVEFCTDATALQVRNEHVACDWHQCVKFVVFSS